MASEIISQPDKYSRRSGDPEPIRCPNCDRDTAVVRRDHRRLWPEITENLAPPLEAYTMESVYSCVICKRTMTVLTEFQSGDSQEREPVAERLIYPMRAPRTLADEAPLSMRELFEEASMAENAGALRAAAAVYRAVVEKLCSDMNCAGADLFKRIEDLAQKGVDRDLVTDLHEARLLGNWSLHEGLRFAAEEVDDVARLIGDAVELLYVVPANKERMRDAREARRESHRRAPGGAARTAAVAFARRLGGATAAVRSALR